MRLLSGIAVALLFCISGVTAHANGAVATVEITSPARQTPPTGPTSEPFAGYKSVSFSSDHSVEVYKDTGNATYVTTSWQYTGANGEESHGSITHSIMSNDNYIFYTALILSSTGLVSNGWHGASASTDVTSSMGNDFKQDAINYHVDAPPTGPGN